MLRELKGYKKGINLGGWLSQCEHTKEHHDTFITEKDIKQISEWGLDHVRVPVDYYIFKDENGNTLDEGFELVDKCLLWCEKYHLNMILDLHKTAGYIFDEKSIPFFSDKALQDIFVELWCEFAHRYGKYHDRLCFELLNEVVDENLSEIWNDIAARAIEEIRKITKDMRIIIGGAKHNSVFCVEKLRAPVDKNMVFTFHCYEPTIFTHQSAYWVEGMPSDFSLSFPVDFDEAREYTEKYLEKEHLDFYYRTEKAVIDKEFFKKLFANAVSIAEKYDIPLYCGEYGVIDRAPLDDTLSWFSAMHEAFEESGIPRAVWTYKAKDFGLVDEHYAKIQDKLIELL